jgi:hypothetical protein
LLDLAVRNGIRTAAAEAIGERALKEPGSGTPMSCRSFTYGAKGLEVAGQLGVAELFVEVGIAECLAANGGGIDANVVRGTFDPAADGDERANFASFEIIECTGTTGHGSVLG